MFVLILFDFLPFFISAYTTYMYKTSVYTLVNGNI